MYQAIRDVQSIYADVGKWYTGTLPKFSRQFNSDHLFQFAPVV